MQSSVSFLDIHCNTNDNLLKVLNPKLVFTYTRGDEGMSQASQSLVHRQQPLLEEHRKVDVTKI